MSKICDPQIKLVEITFNNRCNQKIIIGVIKSKAVHLQLERRQGQLPGPLSLS